MVDRRRADMFPLAERVYIRMQAQDLLTRCLREDSPDALRELLDQLLAGEPPDLELLREILTDISARLSALRERRFDVRNQIVAAFRDGYGIDISSFAPQAAIEWYHDLDADSLFAYLKARGIALEPLDAAMLREVFGESVALAGDLARDIALTESLIAYLSDWLTGLAALLARTSTASQPRRGEVFH